MQEKYLCAMALFDEETNLYFGRLRYHIKTLGVECLEIPPHITLGVYVNLDENELGAWTEEFYTNHSPIRVNFNHIGLFGTTVCFAAPRVDENLLQFHSDYHQKYDDYSGEIGFNYTLKSNNWTPHASVVINTPESILKALPIIQENFEPFIGYIEKIGVYEFSPMREIKVVHLK